jgi:hypothetical protein
MRVATRVAARRECYYNSHNNKRHYKHYQFLGGGKYGFLKFTNYLIYHKTHIVITSVVAVRVWHVVDQAVRGKRSGTPSRVKTSGKRAAGKRSASNRPRAITKSTFETF